MIRLHDILSRSHLAVITYGPDTDLGMCAMWPWPRRYGLGSRSWHTLGSWSTIVWNIIQIQLGNEELWSWNGFWVCVHCDLDLGDMTLGQGYDTPFIDNKCVSRSNLVVRSYGQDTDFQYVCTMTLTFEIWPWVKVMTHPLVIDNKCVKYPDQTCQWGVNVPDTDFQYMCTVTLTLEIWPWVKVSQGHDTSFGQRQ